MTKRATAHHVRPWTVQVASYETLDEAQAMQATLCGRGYQARIVGAVRPYDVRVGRYPTSQAAMAVARRLTSRQLTVFVAPAE
jgi:cell division protein FtsN